MARSKVVVLFCLCVCFLSAAAMAADDTVVTEAGERQLFLDDYVIAEINQLHRTMHQPDKKGAVIRPSPEERVIQARGAPFWDSKDNVFKYWINGLRVSQDGLHWIKADKQPKLPVKITGAGLVFYDPIDSDRDRRYKAWSPASFQVSPDGLNWTKLDTPPIPSQDESNFSLDHKSGLYIATVKHGGIYGRSVFLSTSKDFENWTDPKLIFEADEFDQELARRQIERCFGDPTRRHPEDNSAEHYGLDVYNMAVFRYEGLYIGIPLMFYHTGTVKKDWPGFKALNLSPYIQECVDKYGDYTGFHSVQLVCSRDLHHWNRLGDRKPFIDLSPEGTGAYDTQTMGPPANALVRGDELWFYYTGGKQYAFISSGGKPGYDDYYPDAGAVCLAVLRRDGFISLDAGGESGSIVTKVLRVPEGAKKLFVNVDAAGGELKAVLLTTAAQALEGFIVPQVIPVPGATTRAYPLPLESQSITGDHLQAEVAWEGHEDLSALAGKEIRIRFRLRQASLYSFWFE